MNHAASRFARSILFASALVACAAESDDDVSEGERDVARALTVPSRAARVPVLRAGSIAAGCARGGKAFDNGDGTFGFALTGGLMRAADASTPGSAWFRADCDATLWFGALPEGQTFVIDSAVVETVGTPGVSATLSIFEGWHGKPDAYSSLRGAVTLGASGVASVVVRRAREPDAPLVCPREGYLFTRVGLETRLAHLGQVAETFGIVKVDQIRLVARACIVAAEEPAG